MLGLQGVSIPYSQVLVVATLINSSVFLNPTLTVISVIRLPILHRVNRELDWVELTLIRCIILIKGSLKLVALTLLEVEGVHGSCARVVAYRYASLLKLNVESDVVSRFCRDKVVVLSRGFTTSLCEELCTSIVEIDIKGIICSSPSISNCAISNGDSTTLVSIGDVYICNLESDVATRCKTIYESELYSREKVVESESNLLWSSLNLLLDQKGLATSGRQTHPQNTFWNNMQ